jgi:hypothetical protein
MVSPWRNTGALVASVLYDAAYIEDVTFDRECETTPAVSRMTGGLRAAVERQRHDQLQGRRQP